MSVILNIETSSDVCSVALGREGKLLDVMASKGTRDHARVLTLLIDNVLKKNHLMTDDLNAVAVSKGPGSYTGLRIGVSAAKGLAYGLNIPLIAVSTLKVMTVSVLHGIRKNFPDISEDTWLCPMIDARRMEVYLAFFDLSGKQQTSIRAEVISSSAFDEILQERNVVFFGTGSEKCKKVLVHKNVRFVAGIYPMAADMVFLSYDHFAKRMFEDVAYFEPFYLKEFIATLPKNKLNPGNL